MKNPQQPRKRHCRQQWPMAFERDEVNPPSGPYQYH